MELHNTRYEEFRIFFCVGQFLVSESAGMNCLHAVADGKLGWEECGPYDAIHVGAAAAGKLPYLNFAITTSLATI